ncbi:MAG TPA: SRPBCC family protein [Planctomycetota bacterium]
MTLLYILLGVVGTLVLLVLLVGFTSPRVARMKRSTEIAAPPDRIFPRLNSLKRFVDEWSPWTGRDPAAKHTYNEKAEGVGAKYGWDGDPKKVGTGSMEIVESVPNQRVKIKLWFKGRGEPFAGWLLEDLGGGRSRVTWDFESDAGNNPIGRIFGRLMDKFLGPDYEKGLAKLKEICEKT